MSVKDCDIYENHTLKNKLYGMTQSLPLQDTLGSTEPEHPCSMLPSMPCSSLPAPPAAAAASLTCLGQITTLNSFTGSTTMAPSLQSMTTLPPQSNTTSGSPNMSTNQNEPDVYTSAYATQGYVPFGTDPSAFYSPMGTDPPSNWTLGNPNPWNYEHTIPNYPYTGSGLDVRRKNATRESTSTLKAWLYEHIKNPYPTKGEKIMLAIITKMTLTQVSTWFANARRRLKKENKMQWSPRNRGVDEDDEEDDEEGGSSHLGEGQGHASDESESAEKRSRTDEYIDVTKVMVNDSTVHGATDHHHTSLRTRCPLVNNNGDRLTSGGIGGHVTVDMKLPPLLQQANRIPGTAESSGQYAAGLPYMTSPPSPPITSPDSTTHTADAGDPNSPHRIWSLADVAVGGGAPDFAPPPSHPPLIPSAQHPHPEDAHPVFSPFPHPSYASLSQPPPHPHPHPLPPHHSAQMNYSFSDQIQISPSASSWYQYSVAPTPPGIGVGVGVGVGGVAGVPYPPVSYPVQNFSAGSPTLGGYTSHGVLPPRHQIGVIGYDADHCL